MNLAKEVRVFLNKNRNGILSTISHSVEDHPYGSVCPYMLDHQGRPVIFVSDIAHHTKNMLINDKVCLTVMDESKKHRLDGARVSYMGNILRVPEMDLKFIQARFMRIFPEARSYYTAHDFQFYCIEPRRIRFIEGFAKIHWIESKDFLLEPTNLAETEDSIVNHMNKDHQEALWQYCQNYYHVQPEELELLTIDPEGFMVRTQDEDLYFTFSKLCRTSDDIRGEMIRMVKI